MFNSESSASVPATGQRISHEASQNLYLARLKCIGFDYALDQRIGDEVSRMTQDEAKVPGLSSPSSTKSEAQPEHDHPERLRG
jgi:hypothetical protein